MGTILLFDMKFNSILINQHEKSEENYSRDSAVQFNFCNCLLNVSVNIFLCVIQKNIEFVLSSFLRFSALPIYRFNNTKGKNQIQKHFNYKNILIVCTISIQNVQSPAKIHFLPNHLFFNLELSNCFFFPKKG